MDSAWEMCERENHITDMDGNHSAPHGVTSGCNVAQQLMRNREDLESPKESDSEFSAATADFGCRYVNNVWHHAHRSGVHNIIMAGDCIEGSSMGPTIGAISSHVISPFPQRAHTPPSQQQQLKWQALMVNEWYGLCDGALQDIPQIDFQVETDKGFKFSELDDSFICQKKNHFQITVTILFHKTPKFLKLKDGSIQPIEQFILCLEGIKFEDVSSRIKLKQSKGDRSKIDFQPIVLDVSTEPDKPIKTTICRLHFSETTANNPRKRGKPNPDQKYFSLVVSLRARTKEEDSKPLTVVAHVSERIIVRVSNDVAIALSLVPPMASDIKISCTASASSQATPNNSFQFNVSNEVTSFSVAVAVEKQRRFFVDNLMFGCIPNIKLSTKNLRIPNIKLSTKNLRIPNIKLSTKNLRCFSNTSPSIIDVEVDPTVPSRELPFEHNDCKREIEILKSAVKELQTIVCDLQQRLGVTDSQIHHPPYHHKLHTVQAQHSSTSSLSHMITDTITVQHTTSAASYGGSSQSCKAHPRDFY